MGIRRLRLWLSSHHISLSLLPSPEELRPRYLRVGWRLTLLYGHHISWSNGMSIGKGMNPTTSLLAPRSFLTLCLRWNLLHWGTLIMIFGTGFCVHQSPILCVEWMDGPLRNSGLFLVPLLKFCCSSLPGLSRLRPGLRSFKVWLVVLLRKVPEGILPWSSVRPISVAATLYRTWAKMRTQHLLDHARTLCTATVQPCLSTRPIWGMQVELTAEFLMQHVSPCGVVLDLIKAFNVVCRAFLRVLMLRLGFPPVVINAWFASMRGLCRQPLVAGAVHGSAVSTTGIPEGDPLSILGMFSLCCLFRAVVRRQDSLALPFSYADNWEVVVGNVGSLTGIVSALDRMSSVCMLPVAPSKCWTWALSAEDRKLLRDVTLAGQLVPVKLTGCCLGADMAYSYRTPAATRNGRVSSGHKRLLRLRGLPTSRFRKCRLILGGVYWIPFPPWPGWGPRLSSRLSLMVPVWTPCLFVQFQRLRS